MTTQNIVSSGQELLTQGYNTVLAFSVRQASYRTLSRNTVDVGFFVVQFGSTPDPKYNPVT